MAEPTAGATNAPAQDAGQAATDAQSQSKSGNVAYDESQLPEAARVELSKIRQGISDANKQAAALRDKLKKYEGVDPEKYVELVEAEAKKEEERLRKEGEFDKMLAAERAKTLENAKKAETIQQRWNATEIRREILATAASLGAIPEAMMQDGEGEPSQVEAYYSGRFEVVDGKVVHKTERDDAGQRLSVLAYMQKSKKGAGANLFASSLKGGSGSEGGGTAVGDVVTISRSDPMKSPKVIEAVKAGKQIRYTD